MKIENISTFGELIRSLREKQNLSLREVSEKIGIDTSLIGKLERSERQPTKEQIKLIAQFFGLEEKKLFKEYLSDLIANRILEEEVDIDTLLVAEKKVRYLKTKQDG